MSSNITIILYLQDESSISQLKKNVYEEELQSINRKYPIAENEIDINETYFLKQEDKLEVGFFIRNALEKKISFEDIVLVVQDKDENTVLAQKFNFKELGGIPSHTGRPFVVNFDLKDDTIINGDDNYSLKFKLENTEGFYSIESKIENMPMDISFEEEKELKDFINQLESLRKNEVTVNLFKASYNSNKGINCVLILRNGSNKVVRLDKLPVTLIDEQGNAIARDIFSKEGGLASTRPQKVHILNLEFQGSKVFSYNNDLSKCRALFK